MKFENKVQRCRHLLTKTDERIIEYVQKHPLDNSFLTINSLAYAIETSPATITRSNNKLNYDNFQSMKFSLQHEKSEKSVENAPLIQFIHRYHQNIIQQIGEFVSEEKIKRLACNLKAYRQVNFAGLGSSGLIASEFYYRAMCMGIKSLVSTDAHQMKISASLLSSNDMFVAISSSGEISESIDAVKIARNQGVYVVVITNFEGSTITKNADLVLITSAQSNNNDSRFTNSQIATHFLLDLVSYIFLRDSYIHKLYRQTRQVVLNHGSK